MPNHFYKTMLLLGCLLYPLGEYAQNTTIDSLKKVLQSEKEDTNKVNTLIAFAQQLRHSGDFTNGLKIADSALFLATKISFNKGVGDAYQKIGNIKLSQKNYTEALDNFFAALKIRLTLKDNTRIGYSYNQIATTYNDLNNDSEGLKYAFSGLKFMEASGDKTGLFYAYAYLASLNYSENNFPEALKYYNLALKISKEANDPYAWTSTLAQIGDVYFKQNKYEEALKKYAEVIDITKDTADVVNKGMFAYALLGSGNVYNRKGIIALEAEDKEQAKNDFCLALKDYFNAVKLYKEIDAQDAVIFVYVTMGETLIRQGEQVKAKKYIETSVELAKASGSKDNLAESYRGLVIVDSALSNYKKAFEDHKTYILYRDSLNNDGAARKSLSYSLQYESEKKENIAKAEQEKRDVETKKRRNQQYFVIALLAILGLGALIIALIQYRNNKQKQKANLSLERQKQKVEITLNELKSTQAQLIQSEKMASLGELTAGIAHEIQNPLNFVNNFSEINKEIIAEMKAEIAKGNYDEVNELVNNVEDNEEKILHHGKRADAIVKGMLQHSRSGTSAKELTDINKLTDEYLRLAYHGLRAKDKSFNAEIKTDYDQAIGPINIMPQDIGRVILNLITNAFYAVSEKKKLQPEAYEPTVSVSTKKVGNKVEIRVADNGNGIPQKILDKIFQPFFTTKPTGQGTGLGLSLAYDIVKAHGGELKVKTKEGEGAEFTILVAAG